MATTERAVKLVRHSPKFRLLEVRRAQQITPRLARVTLGGDELDGFQTVAADDHVKLLFPAPGEDRPALPAVTEAGLSFPEGQPRPVTRDFTVRRYDPAAGELDLDFVLHGDGPASTWAADADGRPRSGVGGPRGTAVVPNDFDWYLFAGDETALPAISRWLEELPAGTRAIAFVEVADAEDEKSMATKSGPALTWLYRDGAEPGTTDLQLRALQGHDLPPGDGFAWVAGEARTVASLRRHLIGERGLAKERTRFTGHWKRGVANWNNHERLED